MRNVITPEQCSLDQPFFFFFDSRNCRKTLTMRKIQFNNLELIQMVHWFPDSYKRKLK